MRRKGGALARITPPADTTTLPCSPISKDVPTAHTAKLHEVDYQGETIVVEGSVRRIEKGKGRDWLTLLVLETLGKCSPFNAYLLVLIYM